MVGRATTGRLYYYYCRELAPYLLQSPEATPPSHQQTTSIASNESQSEYGNGGDVADSAISSDGHSQSPAIATPLKDEAIPTQIHIPKDSTSAKDEGGVVSSPLMGSATTTPTPPPPLEGVVKSESGSGLLSRLKKRVVDTAWQGTEAKVSL